LSRVKSLDGPRVYVISPVMLCLIATVCIVCSV